MDIIGFVLGACTIALIFGVTITLFVLGYVGLGVH